MGIMIKGNGYFFFLDTVILFLKVNILINLSLRNEEIYKY